ncbi:MAG: CHASE2 domain-containing protein [Armatimonadota bacterium]
MKRDQGSPGAGAQQGQNVLYAIGLACIFIVWFLSLPGTLLHTFELKSIDWRFQIRGERPPSDEVALILIDEPSINTLGQWPWDRAVHGELIRTLQKAGARAICFDILFTETARGESEDAAFADALKDSGNVILAAYAPDHPEQLPPGRIEALQQSALKPRVLENRNRGLHLPTIKPPVLPIASHARCGLAMAPPDSDGVFRHCYLTAYNDADHKIYPSFALAAAMEGAGVSGEDLEIDFARGMKLGQRGFIPFDSRGRVAVNFSGGRKNRDYFSYAEVLNGRVPPSHFRGRIALVGFAAHGLYDVHPNPFSSDFLGVQFNADVIENVLNANVMNTTSPAAGTLLVILVGLLVTYISTNLRPVSAAGVTFLCVGVFIAAGIFAFTSGNTVISVIPPVSVAILAYTLITFRRLIGEERSRARLRRHFSSYAPPEVVEQLDSGEMMEKLSGVEDEITVLFSDIRDFTAIGSTMEPRRLVRMLNLYFGAMSEVVFDFEGTVDKFIGDGLLVLFNALQEQPDHAKRAVFSAIEMQRRVDSLCEDWAEEGFPQIRIGVGVHTGDAVVGNIGPEMKMDYTAIGSTVSLASRVEGLTKDYKEPIIITEATYQQLDGVVEARQLGEIEIRGIPEPVMLYAVIMGDRGTGDS